jgi:hypothetical protein
MTAKTRLRRKLIAAELPRRRRPLSGGVADGQPAGEEQRPVCVDRAALGLEDDVRIGLNVEELRADDVLVALVMTEPVFANTKFNRRIDRFLRRGRAACRSEWRPITATDICSSSTATRPRWRAPDAPRRRATQAPTPLPTASTRVLRGFAGTATTKSGRALDA